MTKCVRYKKPFLKDVIFRIDFPSPLPNLKQSLPQSLHKVASMEFPMFEPQQAHSQEVRFEGADVQTKSSQLVQWIFHDKQREKSLTIDANSLAITVKKYDGFIYIKNSMLNIVRELYKNYPELLVSRLGVRYINVLSPIDKEGPLDWANYVDGKMLQTLNLQDNNKQIIRAFNILEFNYDGEIVKFQFGIANPDYPASVRRKEYVIDIDSSHYGAFEEGDVMNRMDISHSRIVEIFENSITARTREIMEPETYESQ